MQSKQQTPCKPHAKHTYPMRSKQQTLHRHELLFTSTSGAITTSSPTWCRGSRLSGHPTRSFCVQAFLVQLCRTIPPGVGEAGPRQAGSYGVSSSMTLQSAAYCVF